MSCERHDGKCAYGGTEPDRCPACHSLWSVILACKHDGCGSREAHEAVHAQRDARLERKTSRRAAQRAAAAA